LAGVVLTSVSQERLHLGGEELCVSGEPGSGNASTDGRYRRNWPLNSENAVRVVPHPVHVDLACEPQPGGSLSSAAGEAPAAVLYPARVSSLSDAELDALVAEAVVDCYDEHEQLSGLFAMIEGDLAVPFETEVLGVPVVVRKVDLRSSGIVAICHRGRLRQAIGILDLPLPDPAPDGAQWIEAYRWWAGTQ
jgi:hypothetical protein